MATIQKKSFWQQYGSLILILGGIIIGAVLNTILDPIYIFIFRWGVKGAAIATITFYLGKWRL